MAELRDLGGLNLVFVCMAKPPEAAAFRLELEAPQPFISDPEARLYDAFGLARGKPKQMVSWRVMKRGAAAAKKGHRGGRPVGDVWRLPGSFVLSRTGQVLWEHRAKDVSDNADPEEIASALWEAMDAEA